MASFAPANRISHHQSSKAILESSKSRQQPKRRRLLLSIRLARRTAQGTLQWGRRKASAQFLILASILAGLLAGMAAILLKTVVHALHLLATERALPHLGPLVLVLAPVTGIILTTLATRFLFSREKGMAESSILRKPWQASYTGVSFATFALP